MITRIVPVGDTHSGFRGGLAPKRWVTNEGDQWLSGPAAKLVRKIFDKACRQIHKGADEIVPVYGGDLIHGNRNPHECITTSLKDQADIFKESVLTLNNRASKSYSILGTKYHRDDDGIIEDTIAENLGCFGKRAYPKLEIQFQDTLWSFQHKGPTSGYLAWTEGNAMVARLKHEYFNSLRDGRRCPDYFVWFHFHTYRHVVYEPSPGLKIHGYIMPALSVANEYAKIAVGGLQFSDVGLIYWDVEGDRVTEHIAFERFDTVKRLKH